jgi:hypothetical protein
MPKVKIKIDDESEKYGVVARRLDKNTIIKISPVQPKINDIVLVKYWG